MGSGLAWAGALGGLTAFAAGIVALLRGIFRQIGATEANTRATEANTRRLDDLAGTVERHGTRIARLEGRRIR